MKTAQIAIIYVITSFNTLLAVRLFRSAELVRCPKHPAIHRTRWNSECYIYDKCSPARSVNLKIHFLYQFRTD